MLGQLRQTKFVLGVVLIAQSISCFFLVICYLFRGKKNTAGPFTLLGIISAVAGAMLVAEKIREQYQNEAILEAMNELCDEDEPMPHIPVDDTASEAEFGA